MRIAHVRHKALRRLIEACDPSGLGGAGPKLLLMLAFLQDMGSVAELLNPPKWKAHVMTGDRAGTWALLVTRNWRLTFRLDGDPMSIIELNYEDYH